MQMSDVIADMLTRIRNASNAKHDTVDVPASNMKKSIADILVNEGYIRSYQVIEDGKQGMIRITLKYSAGDQDFTAQLSLEELEAISRGAYIMGHPWGARGNAGIFGGVTESLRDKGVPPVVTTDGPSGIRLYDSCSLLPIGTLLACTFDTGLVENLFAHVGREMKDRGSDVLLAPGMNIHRNPLCGRNFEYFSEDPYVTGKIAAAAVRGIQSQGVSACHTAVSLRPVTGRSCSCWKRLRAISVPRPKLPSARPGWNPARMRPSCSSCTPGPRLPNP